MIKYLKYAIEERKNYFALKFKVVDKEFCFVFVHENFIKKIKSFYGEKFSEKKICQSLFFDKEKELIWIEDFPLGKEGWFGINVWVEGKFKVVKTQNELDTHSTLEELRGIEKAENVLELPESVIEMF